ncbi:DUF3152 domain-containing protein [Millisia brevis]|uniref:DUF3152 domain-containing protein n=1 Tax=Millisia brevis TaxID=264148 RepID=UPI000836BF07|nr:DUF3152 domain-containing protein [Millisia brevis]
MRAHWDPTGGDEAAPVMSRAARRARPARTARKQSRFGRFFATYGWRAYLLPVLVVVTILVAYDAWTVTGGETATEASGDALVVPGFGELTDTEQSTDVIGVPPAADGSFAGSIPSGELPAGGPFTAQGLGDWHIVPGTTGQVGVGRDRVFTYTVEIEDGVDTTSFGGDGSFAEMVDATLANPKSWIGDERFAFRRIDSGDPDFRVSLTSQMSVRPACGYDIPLEVSCYNPSIGRVILNEPRWVRGAIAFQGDVGSYRQYVINHEVGHAIGYAAHQPCESNDGLAPIMMQQTFGTANDDIAALDPAGVVPMNGLVCRYNPWPYPRT